MGKKEKEKREEIIVDNPKPYIILDRKKMEAYEKVWIGKKNDKRPSK